MESVLKPFASKQGPLALSFPSSGAFPNKNNLLFLAPAPTMALLQFQAQLSEAIRKEGIEIAEEFKVESWIPYCPVAQEVSKTRIAESFCVLTELKLPVSGHFSFGLGNTIEIEIWGLHYYTLHLVDVRWWQAKQVAGMPGYSNGQGSSHGSNCSGQPFSHVRASQLPNISSHVPVLAC
ncbi:hypothetical protein V6N13_085920 [Hibiscus sabdariffa]|uniref:Uncharacterized protein n=1 Tax=Hibiscus sabdariffa TaxID=183260 RepID=A0ABR2FS40_9ROSI